MKSELFQTKCKEDRLDQICFNLILLDIFFIPLFPWFSISISLPILYYWFLKRGGRTRYEAERTPFPLVVLLMLLSVLVSLVYDGETQYETSFSTTVKLFIMFVSYFLYFFFFKYFFAKYRRKIDGIVFWGIMYIAFYALFFTIAPEQFNSFKSIVAPFDPQVRRWYDGGELLLRFNYLWADPNNVAYATDALLAFYLIESKNSVFRKFFAILISLFILFCTMSIGGIGVMVAVLGYVFVFTNVFRDNKYSAIFTISLIILLAVSVVAFLPTIQELFQTGLALRLDAYDSSGNMSGGRFGDFTRGLSRLSPILLFVGTGKEGFVTENGHLFVIFMYGFPVYCYFLYVLYWKRRRMRWVEYLSILPFFVGFTMNIAIIEQKFLLLNLLVIAYYASLCSLRKNKVSLLTDKNANNIANNN